jgi:hypothetical protein
VSWRTFLWSLAVIAGLLTAGLTLHEVWSAAGRIDALYLQTSNALAVLCPIVAGAVAAYARYHAFDEESLHYGRMQLMFHSADAVLRDSLEAGKTTEAQALIEELGSESMAENGDWLITHRDRPVTLASP